MLLAGIALRLSRPAFPAAASQPDDSALPRPRVIALESTRFTFRCTLPHITSRGVVTSDGEASKSDTVGRKPHVFPLLLFSRALIPDAAKAAASWIQSQRRSMGEWACNEQCIGLYLPCLTCYLQPRFRRVRSRRPGFQLLTLYTHHDPFLRKHCLRPLIHEIQASPTPKPSRHPCLGHGPFPVFRSSPSRKGRERRCPRAQT